MEPGGLASTHPHCSHPVPTPSLCPRHKSTSQILVKYILVLYVTLTAYTVTSGPSLLSAPFLPRDLPPPQPQGRRFLPLGSLCGHCSVSQPFHAPVTCSGGAVRAPDGALASPRSICSPLSLHGLDAPPGPSAAPSGAAAPPGTTFLLCVIPSFCRSISPSSFLREGRCWAKRCVVLRPRPAFPPVLSSPVGFGLTSCTILWLSLDWH